MTKGYERGVHVFMYGFPHHVATSSAKLNALAVMSIRKAAMALWNVWILTILIPGPGDDRYHRLCFTSALNTRFLQVSSIKQRMELVLEVLLMALECSPNKWPVASYLESTAFHLRISAVVGQHKLRTVRASKTGTNRRASSSSQNSSTIRSTIAFQFSKTSIDANDKTEHCLKGGTGGWCQKTDIVQTALIATDVGAGPVDRTIKFSRLWLHE